MIDVATGNDAHFQVSWDALQAGKHVLCEKPVHHEAPQTKRAAELARSKGLKTKLGFTFRYAPAVQYAKELLDQGFVGEPYIFNGYEQNSQWLDPSTPLRQADATDPEGNEIAVSSIEGYGAPIIDIMHWWVGARWPASSALCATSCRSGWCGPPASEQRMNIDDGDMFICEFDGDVIASIQSSYVTVGNYPGIEARIYGSEGALIVRLVEESGICQTLKTARKDSVEFVEQEIPERFFPGAATSREEWPSLFYSNLVRNFADEILERRRGEPGRLRPGHAGPAHHQRLRGVGPPAPVGCPRRGSRCLTARRAVPHRSSGRRPLTGGATPRRRTRRGDGTGGGQRRYRFRCLVRRCPGVGSRGASALRRPRAGTGRTA